MQLVYKLAAYMCKATYVFLFVVTITMMLKAQYHAW
jgi:hypothetical protein